jgi:LysR family transcriptional regulator, hydrogen peroxide-inducible genes activator
MAVTLKQLRYVVALAEAGSFGAAAADVHVSQPALSLQVKELETHLGATLVDRLPRGVKLTRAGREVVARARRILAETGDLEQAMRWRQGLAGQLALGVIPTVAPYLLPTMLKALRAAVEELDIRIREARTEDLLEDVEGGRLDAAIVALPVADTRLTSIPLFEDRFVLAGPENGPAEAAAAPERLRPDLIDPDQLLLLEEGHCLADQALEICGFPARRKVDLGASSLSTLSGLVAMGLGLTLLPEISLRAECAAAPHLRITRFDAPEPSRTIGLIHRGSELGAGWLEDLSSFASNPASDLIDHARRAYPSRTTSDRSVC